MREHLEQQYLRERESAPPASYHARVGHTGHRGAHVVVEDVRHADTDEPITDHVWFPLTREFAAFAHGDRIRFSAAVQPYMKAGPRDVRGRHTPRVLDYGFARPSLTEKIAMSIYDHYLLWKQADDSGDAATVAADIGPGAATASPGPDGGESAMDLKVLGGTMHQHMIAQTQGYMPIATLHNGDELTHIVYSHRKTWNAAQKLLHRDPARFTVVAHGLVRPEEGTPGGRVQAVKYG